MLGRIAGLNSHAVHVACMFNALPCCRQRVLSGVDRYAHSSSVLSCRDFSSRSQIEASKIAYQLLSMHRPLHEAGQLLGDIPPPPPIPRVRFDHHMPHQHDWCLKVWGQKWTTVSRCEDEGLRIDLSILHYDTSHSRIGFSLSKAPSGQLKRLQHEAPVILSDFACA